MKGFTDIMMAILIGVLLVFGALVFFATEVNNMTRSINLVLREYEIEMASNEFFATKRSLETATLLGGANSVFDVGLIGIGEIKKLTNDEKDIYPEVWYINHTPPELYLFKSYKKEYRYIPTKKDVERKLGIVLDKYFNETNNELNKLQNHRVKLPGLNIIDIRIITLGSGGAKIMEVPDYGTLNVPKIGVSNIPGAIPESAGVPDKNNNYVYIPVGSVGSKYGSNIYGSSFYLPKCYLFGGKCTPIQGTPDDTIKTELGCDDVTCGCPENNMCIGIQSCNFDCPLDESHAIYMTSGFGCRNITVNGINKMEFHPGTDLVYGDSETKIYAPAEGILYNEYTESESGGYGNMLILAHGCYGSGPKIYFSIYGHLYSFNKLNWEIDKRELIGYMGHSGISNGIHLHYEIRENENNIKNGVIEVLNPGAGNGLINPCTLSGNLLCGMCDCKSECAHELVSCSGNCNCNGCHELFDAEEQCT